jgi:Protein of unknown function (DUF1566)
MYRNLLAGVIILAMQATAFNAVADCTAGNPNAFVIETTPTSAFTDHGNGTVTHSLTGLMWKRCVQGLSGADCATGTATEMHWSAALAAAVTDTTAGYNDWRLPNKKELESLVEFCGFSPSINQTLFPAALGSGFWSGSTYARDPAQAWEVGFDDGHTGANNKSSFSFNVRLVRGGQSFGSFDANQPPSTLDVDGNGTADALTDGLLVVRYLFALRGAALIQGAVGAGALRTTAPEIETYLQSSTLDVDGNGTPDALTDGLLVVRYLFGLRGAALIQGAVGAGAVRTSAAEIENFLQSILP